MYKQKYLKYKNKYFNLKQNGGGTLRIISPHTPPEVLDVDDDIIRRIPTQDTSWVGFHIITKYNVKENDLYTISYNGSDYRQYYTFDIKEESQPYESLSYKGHSSAASDTTSDIYLPYEKPCSIEIIGSSYNINDRSNTDFTLMIKQEQYANTLFIFNDNVESHNTSSGGDGNAAIRIYNKHRTDGGKPQSAGISTGFLDSYRGFLSLKEQINKIVSMQNGGKKQLKGTAQEIIDSDIQEIRDLIKTHGYDKIIWSKDETTGKLGAALFKDTLGQDVIEYITQQIKNLGCN